MAHRDWCGKSCSECSTSCGLDESMVCSPDCEYLDPITGKPNSAQCKTCSAIREGGIDMNITLTTYGEYFEATDTQLTKSFNVPFEWLESQTLDIFNWTVDEFLEEYTWDNTEEIYNLAIEEGMLIECPMIEPKEDCAWELCPECDTEVKLANKFEPQICPSCRKSILPCSICSDQTYNSCNRCPLMHAVSIEEFILRGNLVRPKSFRESEIESLFAYNFDTMKDATDCINEGEITHIYTIIDGEGRDCWLIVGKHFVNRIGYIVSRNKLTIPEEGLRI